MKKLSKFSYLFALPFTIISFVLMLATNAIINDKYKVDIFVPGTEAVFGHKPISEIDPPSNPSPLALTAWILALVAILIIVLGVFLRFIYRDELEKAHIVLSFIAIICLILAGIFMFNVVSTFWSANDMGYPLKGTRIGTGWGVAASFYFLSALILLFPIVVSFADRS